MAVTITRRTRPSRTARGTTGTRAGSVRAAMTVRNLGVQPSTGINGATHGTSSQGRGKSGGSSGERGAAEAKVPQPKRRVRFGQF